MDYVCGLRIVLNGLIISTMKEQDDYILSLRNAHQQYDDKVILNGIDLKIKPGEFLTVVGPTGCGKSTTLRLILGAEKPSKGEVFFHGKKIKDPDRNRGVVFQKYSLLLSILTVYSRIMLYI